MRGSCSIAEKCIGWQYSDADPIVQKRYREHYATTRLRRLATSRAGSRHHDLYCGLKLVMDKLSGDGCPELALPALGSFLFSPRALSDLNSCEIANLHLLEAIRSLAVTHTGQSRRVVDYKNLGAEELGSVYESLLELHPEVSTEAATFELKMAAGSERKTTGSYYTPTSLIDCLLNSALDPVLGEAEKHAEAEKAILALKVVDPACGSGHFLIAAAHRIAKRLASVRTGEEEPPPEAQRRALRDVIGHCIYGVDLNPKDQAKLRKSRCAQTSCVRHSIRHSGRMYWPRPRSGRRASTSTAGASP